MAGVIKGNLNIIAVLILVKYIGCPFDAGGRRQETGVITTIQQLFPEVDITLNYQSVINPAFDPTNGHAAAFSFRIRSVF